MFAFPVRSQIAVVEALQTCVAEVNPGHHFNSNRESSRTRNILRPTRVRRFSLPPGYANEPKPRRQPAEHGAGHHQRFGIDGLDLGSLRLGGQGERYSRRRRFDFESKGGGGPARSFQSPGHEG